MAFAVFDYQSPYSMEMDVESGNAFTGHHHTFSSQSFGIPPSDPILDDASEYDYGSDDDDAFSDAGSEMSLDSCSARCNPHERPISPFEETPATGQIEAEIPASQTQQPIIALDTAHDLPPPPRIFESENGREYHAYRAGKYLFPEDIKEKDRGDLVHMMHIQLLEGELHTAPLDNPKRILDLGAGSSIWAVDMAMRYPDATIYTLDLSPLPLDAPPPNITSLILDFDLAWPFPTNYFDFIHCREIHAGTENYPNLIKKIYKHLRPGGYVEIIEMPFRVQSKRAEPIPSDYPLVKHFKLLNKALKAVGRDPQVLDQLPAHVQDSQYIDITTTKTVVPLCTWAREMRWKDVGRLNMLNFLEGLEGWSLAPCTRGMGISPESVKRKVRRCNKGIMDRRMNLFCEIVRVMGMKPIIGEVFTEERRALREPTMINPV